MNILDGGIFIPSSTLASFPDDLRAALLKSVFGYSLDSHSGVAETPLPGVAETMQDDGLPPLPSDIVTLDDAQARAVLAPPMHHKTRSFLRAVAMKPTPFFDVADIAAEIGEPAHELSGVLSGITSRVRAVTKMTKGKLFDRYGEPKTNASGIYVSQAVRLRPEAHAALKAVFDAQA